MNKVISDAMLMADTDSNLQILRTLSGLRILMPDQGLSCTMFLLIAGGELKSVS